MKFSISFIAQVIALCVLATHLFAQNTSSAISTQESLEESVKSVPCKSEERLEGVKNLFIKMGAKPEDVITEKFDKDKISNVVVTKKGKTDEKIIVGAHYDKTSEGCGAVDNWTGISIIAHLYKTLSKFQTNKTFIFVAFDQEEIGLLGSAAMVKNIPKENREQYCSMINFDSFGFTVPFVLQNASSPKLTDLAQKLAKENKFKMVDAMLDGDSDSSSFKMQKIPAITFSGLDNNWATILHSKNDQIGKINIASVYFGYRFGFAFLAKLDGESCREKK